MGCHFLPQGIFPTQELSPVSPALASGFFTTEPPGKPLCDDVILVKQNTEQQEKVHPVSCSDCQVDTCQDTGLFLPGHRHLSQASEGGRVPRPKNYRKMPVGKVCWWRHPGEAGGLWTRWRTLAESESVSCSVVSESATPWTVAHQAPLSVELSRQGYWSG